MPLTFNLRHIEAKDLSFTDILTPLDTRRTGNGRLTRYRFRGVTRSTTGISPFEPFAAMPTM